MIPPLSVKIKMPITVEFHDILLKGGGRCDPLPCFPDTISGGFPYTGQNGAVNPGLAFFKDGGVNTHGLYQEDINLKIHINPLLIVQILLPVVLLDKILKGIPIVV